jgi:ATP phosphoribosyltransferase
MLRIAVPNKGSLSGPAAEMLHEAGYQQRRESKELVIVDPDNEVEFFYLRPRDIATYVGSGALDVGITGRDLLGGSGAAAGALASRGAVKCWGRNDHGDNAVRSVQEWVATHFLSRQPAGGNDPSVRAQRANVQAPVHCRDWLQPNCLCAAT